MKLNPSASTPETNTTHILNQLYFNLKGGAVNKSYHHHRDHHPLFSFASSLPLKLSVALDLLVSRYIKPTSSDHPLMSPRPAQDTEMSPQSLREHTLAKHTPGISEVIPKYSGRSKALESLGEGQSLPFFLCCLSSNSVH